MSRLHEFDSMSVEDLEAAESIYDNVLSGTHEARQAEAVRWLREFRNPNDTKPGAGRIVERREKSK